jgi:capsular exopolysaccharide synthesis family protein
MELRIILDILLRRKWLIAKVFAAIFLTIVVGTLLITPSYDATAKVILRKSAVEGSLASGIGAVTSSSGTTISDTEKANYLAWTTLRPFLQQVIDEQNITRERVRGKVMKTLPFLKPVLRFLGANVSYAKKLKPEQLISRSLLSRLFPRPYIEVEEVEDSDIIKIKALSPDPAQAMQVANAVAEALRDAEIERNREEYRKARGFIDDNMKRVKSEYFSATDAIINFKKKEKSLNVEDESNVIEEKVRGLRESLEENDTELKKLQASLKHLEEKIKDQPMYQKSSETLKSNELITSLKTSLQDLFIDLAEKRLKYTEIHPSVIEVRKKIEEGKALMKKEIEKIFSSETFSIDPIYADFKDRLVSGYLNIAVMDIQNEITADLLEKYEAKLLAMPVKIFDFSQLSLIESISSEIYNSLYKLRYKLDIAELLSLSNIFIVERAVTPGRGDSSHRHPSLLINTIIAILLGLTLGIGSALLAEYMDDTVRSRGDLLAFEKLTFLGNIRRLQGNGDHAVDVFDAPALLREDFRSLRNKLRFLSPDAQPRNILVTSPAGGEGKSFVAANLAVSLAEADNKVLLLDANLRRPVLHEYFGLTGDAGLVNYLSGEVEPGKIRLDTGVNGLTLIAAGAVPADPGRFVESEKMQRTVKEMEESFDYVIIDTPPVSEASDAAVLGVLTHGVLLVLESGGTKRERLREAVEIFETASANILGAVLNKAPLEREAFSLREIPERLRDITKRLRNVAR